MAKKSKEVKQSKTTSKKTAVTAAVSSDRERPVWLFTNLDREGQFAFDTNRPDFDHKDFIEKMIQYSGMTWAEIKKQTHDDGKSKNHMISYDKLSKDAQDRFHSKRLLDYEDAIFSFAFNNLTRIIGIRKREKFEVLWYDAKHEVCPSTLKHT